MVLSIIFQFLVFLFHFVVNAYFIWINHQLSVIQDVHGQHFFGIRKKLESLTTLFMNLDGTLKTNSEQLGNQIDLLGNQIDDQHKRQMTSYDQINQALTHGFTRVAQLRGRMLEELEMLKQLFRESLENDIRKLYREIEANEQKVFEQTSALINSLTETISSTSENTTNAIKQTNEHLEKNSQVLEKNSQAAERRLDESVKELKANLNDLITRAEATFIRLFEDEKNLLLDNKNHFENIHKELVTRAEATLTRLFEDEKNLLLDNKNNFENIHKDTRSSIEALVKAQAQEAKKAIESQGGATRYEVRMTYNRIDALMSIHKLIEPKLPLPVMSDWAVSSDYGLLLISRLFNNAGDVIDIGSGITTLLAAYVLKMRGKGKVYSLEHDPHYYDQTLRWLNEHELHDYVNLFLCPLKNHKINEETWLWYDISKARLPKAPRLISVDGPPSNTQLLARYPAIPLLNKRITKDTIILLDDAGRQDEKTIGERWVAEYGLQSEHIKNHKGTLVFWKR